MLPPMAPGVEERLTKFVDAFSPVLAEVHVKSLKSVLYALPAVEIIRLACGYMFDLWTVIRLDMTLLHVRAHHHASAVLLAALLFRWLQWSCVCGPGIRWCRVCTCQQFAGACIPVRAGA